MMKLKRRIVKMPISSGHSFSATTLFAFACSPSKCLIPESTLSYSSKTSLVSLIPSLNILRNLAKEKCLKLKRVEQKKSRSKRRPLKFNKIRTKMTPLRCPTTTRMMASSTLKKLMDFQTMI